MSFNATPTTAMAQYPCQGSFRSLDNDLMSQMITNSTDFAWHSPPLTRLMLLMEVEERHDTFTRALVVYGLVGLISLCCAILVNVCVVRSGVQSTVAFVLERGNRCKINLAVKRPILLASVVVLLDVSLYVPHAIAVVAGVHLGVLSGRWWVGLLMVTFASGLNLFLLATTTSLSSCVTQGCGCGPEQHRTVVKQFMGGLGFILATWVVQIMTLMRDFYAATAMALTLSALPLMVLLYVTAGGKSKQYTHVLESHILTNEYRNGLRHMAHTQAHQVFAVGRRRRRRRSGVGSGTSGGGVVQRMWQKKW